MLWYGGGWLWWQDGEALAILDERLARGEIDSEEYQRLRGLIASGGQQALQAAPLTAGSRACWPSPRDR